MKKWQLVFSWGWWDWDIVWDKYQPYDRGYTSFRWWRIGPFELRVYSKK